MVSETKEIKWDQKPRIIFCFYIKSNLFEFIPINTVEKFLSVVCNRFVVALPVSKIWGNEKRLMSKILIYILKSDFSGFYFSNFLPVLFKQILPHRDWWTIFVFSFICYLYKTGERYRLLGASGFFWNYLKYNCSSWWW